jgi:ATP-dependent helicase/nuclease subunit B
MILLPGAIAAVLHEGGTVVLPSRQRAHAVQLAAARAQLARGARVWRTPDVLPLSAWLARELARQGCAEARLPRLLTPVEEWWLWRECALEATADLPLVNRSALAEGLRAAHRLAAEHGIGTSPAGLPGTESALLAAVQRAVQTRAAGAGAATLAQLVAAAPCGGSQAPLLFAGFVQPTPQLLALAASRGLPAGLAPLPAGPAEPLGVPGVRRPADEDTELAEIAQWCHAQARKAAGARLLVMLPGPPGRRERLAVLIRQTLDPRGWLTGGSPRDPVAIEGGSPLAHAPVAAHALACLALLCGRTLDPAGLSSWLLSPCWSHAAAARHPLVEAGLAQAGALAWSLRELLAALPQLPRPAAGAARELARRLRAGGAVLRPARAGMRHWAQRMQEALQHLGWPGAGRRDSGEQQTVARFLELIDEAGSLDALAGPVGRGRALAWLAELAARTAFAPADPDPLVTICPQLIDPVVTHDAIWVAGLTADSFPAPVAPDPYLPLAAQRAAKVPAACAAGRLAEAQALLAAWRAATPDLTLSAPARAGDLALLPSPLLAGWPPQESEPAAPPPWLPLQLQRQEQSESWVDAAGTPWPADLPLPAGTRTLDLMSLCPFRAYAELRLAAAQRRAPQPGVAPEVRGQLLHGALQRFWSEVRDSQRLSALTPRALTGLIRRCVRSSARELPAEPRRGIAARRALARERVRAQRLIADLTTLERGRAPFTVEATEFSARLSLGERPLAVRIDRIDVLASGGRAVLDYKSGRRSAADWYGARPSHPQLMTYLAAAGPDVVALATVNINARELRYDGVAQTPGLLPRVASVAPVLGLSQAAAWDAQRRAWIENVNRLAAAFASGQAQVDPRPGACEHCHLAGLCRTGEGGAGWEGEVREEEGESVAAPGAAA